jgi:calcineurin-like phosphoesterase family protein
VPAPAWKLPAPARIVAVGDLHGDFAATKRALRLAGVLDDSGHWSGGDTMLVQTGDILDRGDGEQAMLDLFEQLRDEAQKAGGSVQVVNGNHELMNAVFDFRYVTPGGFSDFEDAPGVDEHDPRVAALPPEQRARASAFRPGGPYAKKLAALPVVLEVGDTVFVHGGVLPKHVDYGIERMNREVSAWLLGRDPAGAMMVKSTDSPVWSRHYSDEPDEADCKLLDEALQKMGAARMVVGHTVQRTATPACGEKVWRIDVGLAALYGGPTEVLEITREGVRVLRGASQ